MKGYLYLFMSIIGEIFATTMLKSSVGFTILLPSIGVVVGYLFSFYFLALCLRSIPLSLAYAIWAGVGTALTALLGFLLWGDLFSIINSIGLILIIGGVILLSSLKSATPLKNDIS